MSTVRAKASPDNVVYVNVDMGKCVSSGTCTTIAPGIFKLDEEGKLVVMKSEVYSVDIEAAKDAIACCPVEAISLQHTKG
jgi:ferredoxin